MLKMAVSKVCRLCIYIYNVALLLHSIYTIKLICMSSVSIGDILSIYRLLRFLIRNLNQEGFLCSKNDDGENFRYQCHFGTVALPLTLMFRQWDSTGANMIFPQSEVNGMMMLQVRLEFVQGFKRKTANQPLRTSTRQSKVQIKTSL